MEDSLACDARNRSSSSVAASSDFFTAAKPSRLRKGAGFSRVYRAEEGRGVAKNGAPPLQLSGKLRRPALRMTGASLGRTHPTLGGIQPIGAGDAPRLRHLVRRIVGESQTRSPRDTGGISARPAAARSSVSRRPRAPRPPPGFCLSSAGQFGGEYYAAVILIFTASRSDLGACLGAWRVPGRSNVTARAVRHALREGCAPPPRWRAPRRAQRRTRRRGRSPPPPGTHEPRVMDTPRASGVGAGHTSPM